MPIKTWLSGLIPALDFQPPQISIVSIPFVLVSFLVSTLQRWTQNPLLWFCGACCKRRRHDKAYNSGLSVVNQWLSQKCELKGSPLFPFPSSPLPFRPLPYPPFPRISSLLYKDCKNASGPERCSKHKTLPFLLTFPLHSLSLLTGVQGYHPCRKVLEQHLYEPRGCLSETFTLQLGALSCLFHCRNWLEWTMFRWRTFCSRREWRFRSRRFLVPSVCSAAGWKAWGRSEWYGVNECSEDPPPDGARSSAPPALSKSTGYSASASASRFNKIHRSWQKKTLKVSESKNR